MTYTSGSSVDLQRRTDTLKARADSVFDYEWLFQLLWDEFRNDVKQPLNTFCDSLRHQCEKRFVWAFIESHRSSLKEILDMRNGLFEDEDFGIMLFEERERLIEEFSSMHLSLRWAHVNRGMNKKKPSDSWRTFAANLDFNRPEGEQQLRRFLYLLDKICLITSLLTDRATDIGLEVNLVKYKRARLQLKPRPVNEPPRDILVKAISQCRDLFTRQTAWAVVYSLCREDYSVEDNKSQFERYAQELLSDPELSDFPQGCPNGTIQSAETGKNGSGRFFRLPSSTWTINNGYVWAIDLMAKLRQAINVLEIEKRANEQKELYKLSQQGF
jgi:hypothetical protein